MMPLAKNVVEPWPFDKPLPSVMAPRVLRQVLGVRPALFYRNQKRGLYRFLEVQRPIGVNRYSGYLVDLYRRGESVARFGIGSRRSA
jgi:hypothetical protein